jgi:hypothetical protein
LLKDCRIFVLEKSFGGLLRAFRIREGHFSGSVLLLSQLKERKEKKNK